MSIQWQYRGIENPFGEASDIMQGFQQRDTGFVSSIRANNIIYTRDATKDGASSLAWTNGDGTSTVWTVVGIAANVHAFSDANLEQDTGYAIAIVTYMYSKQGYWETLATDEYTGTDQALSANPAYTWRRNRWPKAVGYIQKFNPATFYAITNTVYGTTFKYMYLPDVYYDVQNTGSRTASIGGAVADGNGNGMGHYIMGWYGLTNASAAMGFRLSC